MGAAPLSFLAQITGDTEVANKVRNLGGAMSNFGKQADTAAGQTENVGKANVRLVSNMKDTALSFSAAAASVTSLYFQYDGLQKVQLRVGEAENMLTKARGTAIGAQRSLEALEAKGITTGAQYEQARLKLAGAQEDLRLKTEKLSIAQGDLSQAQTQFALTVVPTVISAGTSLANGLKNIDFSAVGARISTLLLGTTSASTAGMLTTTGIASGGAATGIRGVGTASRFTQLAMGPFGWIMIGIGTALTLVATNAFGVRDAIYGLGKAIGDAVPFLKPFLELLGQAGQILFPETEAQAAEMNAGISSDMSALATSTQASVTEQGASLGELKDAFAGAQEGASGEIATLADNTHTEAARIINDAERIRKAMESIGTAPAAITPPSVAAPASSPAYRTPQEISQQYFRENPTQEQLRSQFFLHSSPSSAVAPSTSGVNERYAQFKIQLQSTVQVDKRDIGKAYSEYVMESI